VTQDDNKTNTNMPESAPTPKPSTAESLVTKETRSKSAPPKAANVSKSADRASAVKPNQGKPKPAKQNLVWLLLFAVLLLMVAVIGLGYWQWQAQTQTETLTTGQSGQSQNLQRWQLQQQSLSQKIDDLTVTNNAAQLSISAQQADLKDNQVRMDKALVNALETMAKTQLDQGKVLPQWQLAEAEYLLRLANQRLAMEQASASAIALLKAADIIVRDSEQVGTYGIRRAIAADLAALSAVPSVDVEGVYARLAALSGMAAKLTFIPPSSMPTAADAAPKMNSKTSPEAMPTEVVSWWLSLWQGTKHVGAKVWGELKQLVKVQTRSQEQGQQLLTPAAELLVRMRIEMGLSQTQVALLRRQQIIYDQSLVGVKQLLTQYYRPSDGVAQAMHAQIDSLDEVKVLASMPNISGSLVALQGFIATLHDTPTQPLLGE
jgi:uroporphyrin-3 C-methyltransferase